MAPFINFIQLSTEIIGRVDYQLISSNNGFLSLASPGSRTRSGAAAASASVIGGIIAFIVVLPVMAVAA